MTHKLNQTLASSYWTLFDPSLLPRFAFLWRKVLRKFLGSPNPLAFGMEEIVQILAPSANFSLHPFQVSWTAKVANANDESDFSFETWTFHFSGEGGFVELERVKRKEEDEKIIYSEVDMERSDMLGIRRRIKTGEKERIQVFHNKRALIRTNTEPYFYDHWSVQSIAELTPQGNQLIQFPTPTNL